MNYENFARPEAELAFAYPSGPAIELECGYPCEECGTICDERFCCAECETDAHTLGEPDEDGCPEEMEFEDDGQPSEYQEWQDYMGGDDSDHGDYGNGYYEE